MYTCAFTHRLGVLCGFFHVLVAKPLEKATEKIDRRHVDRHSVFRRQNKTGLIFNLFSSIFLSLLQTRIVTVIYRRVDKTTRPALRTSIRALER